jgi:hypothetical protein
MRVVRVKTREEPRTRLEPMLISSATGATLSRSVVNRWNSVVKAAAFTAQRLIAHMDVHAISSAGAWPHDRRAAEVDRESGY